MSAHPYSLYPAQIAPPSPASQGALTSWHVVVADLHGNGATLEWTVEGPAHDPGRATLGVRVFAGHALSFTAAAEVPGHWEYPAERWALGGTRIEALRDLTNAALIAHVDLPLPGGGALTGTVELGGLARHRTTPPDDAPDTWWCPMMGYGEGRVLLGAPGHGHFHLQGRAVFVRAGRPAGAPAPVLHTLGLAEAQRFVLSAGVHHAGLSVDRRGSSTHVDVVKSGAGFDTVGADAPEAFIAAEHIQTVTGGAGGALEVGRGRVPMQLPGPLMRLVLDAPSPRATYRAAQAGSAGLGARWAHGATRDKLKRALGRHLPRVR